MNRKIIGLVVVLAMISMVVAACQRPASVSPTFAPITTQEEIPFPAATQPQIMADILKATQTALALTPAVGGDDFPMVTNTPAFVFNTPTEKSTLSMPMVTSTPFIGTTTPGTGGVLETLSVGTVIAAPTSTPIVLATSTPIVLATATATAISYPTPTPGRPATYTIQAGEYLWCIARRFDVSIDALYSANKMNYQSQPGIGTVLTIPSSGSFGSGRARRAHPATYTVSWGDTIGSIACYYGDADPNTIYAANGMTPGTPLTIGQVLQIP